MVTPRTVKTSAKLNYVADCIGWKAVRKQTTIGHSERHPSNPQHYESSITQCQSNLRQRISKIPTNGLADELQSCFVLCQSKEKTGKSIIRL